jgi:hypothetical protein
MRLQAELGLAFLFISHDIAVVERISHCIAVMNLGEIVEIGPRASIIENPQHPYARKLMPAAPTADPARRGFQLGTRHGGSGKGAWTVSCRPPPLAGEGGAKRRMRGRAGTCIFKQITDLAPTQRTSLAIARSRRLTAPTPHPALRATFPRKGGRE